MKTVMSLLLISAALPGIAQDMVADTVKQTLKARVVEEVTLVDNAATASVTERSTRLVNKSDTPSEVKKTVVYKNERIPDSLRILKPNPKAQGRPVDAFMRAKQDWMDQVTMQIDEVNQEIQMLQNNGSGRKSRLGQLDQLKTQSLEAQEALEKANTELQLQKAVQKTKPVLTKGRQCLSQG